MTRQTITSTPPASRRRFVKLFVLLTISSALPRWSRRFVVADVAANEPGIFNVDITHPDFEALQDPGHGSVIVAVPGTELPPIIITRVSDQDFRAVTSVCTHAGCTVYPYSTGRGGIYCSCHGSLFTAEGTVINGPAPAPLTGYPTVFDGTDRVKILIPALGYSISPALVPAGDGQRLQLAFRTVAGFTYRVEFCPTLTGAWTTVAFALTAAGPTNQSQFLATNTELSVFVVPAGSRGFYRVTVT